MLLQASYGCYLTQSAEVAMSERRFELSVSVNNGTIGEWKEVTNEERLSMSRIVDVSDINTATLDKLDSVLKSVTENINESGMSAKDAIEKKSFFPKFEDCVGKDRPVGYRMQYNGKLYEVIQAHKVQSDWTPDTAVALFKVVQVEAEGTEDDVIDWESGMVLENGKYYMDGGVKYLCIRDSVNPLYYALADLVSGGYVTVVE